jgi:hypothetical protein
MKKKEIIIFVAIAVIFALFVGYGIEVFDPSPDYDDFCEDDLYNIDNEKECITEGGSWNEFGVPVQASEGDLVKPNKRLCSPGKECRDSYDIARTKHDKIVFISTVIIGLIAIFVGILLKKDAVSVGILSGGILVIIYGTLRYWQHADERLKFVLLGIVLAVLIWVGYKKFDSKGK